MDSRLRTSPARALPERRRRRVWRRWILRTLALMAGLIGFAAIALCVLVRSLNQPWLKNRLLGLARTSAGLEIDYRSARVDLLSGVQIEGLVVRSPLEVRPFASELSRVGRVDVRWSVASLLRGGGPVIRRISVSNAVLTAVVDEHGRTSFDALSPASSAPKSSAVPTSHLAEKFLGTAPPIGELEIDHVTLAVVRTERGEVAERTQLGGLAVTVASQPVATGTNGWRLQAHLGSPEMPLDMQLTRSQRGAPTASARAKLWLAVDATSTGLTAAVDLRMLDQTLDARLPTDHWLHAEANLRFDRTGGRTEITLRPVETGDGAASFEASIDIPDTGDAIVHRARGDIDIARLLRWLPADLVPATAERATMHVQVDSLVGGANARLIDGGAIAVEIDASNAMVSTPGSMIHVAAATLSAHAQPDHGGITVRGSATLGGVRFESGANRLVASGLVVDVDGQRGSDGGIGGRVGLTLTRFESGSGAPIVCRDGHVELRVEGLHADAPDLLAARGDVAVSLQLASLDARISGMHATVADLAAQAHANLTGHAPYDIEMGVRTPRVRVVHDAGVWVDAPAHFEGRARNVEPDFASPMASRGVVKTSVDVGALRASLEATKQVDAIDFTFGAAAPDLRAARPFLAAPLRDAAPWDRMALALRSSGRVEGLGRARTLAVRQTTHLDVERPAFANVSAQSLSLTLKSDGTAREHEFDVDLLAPGLSVAGGRPIDDHVALWAEADLDRASLRFRLATEGHAATQLAGSLSFESAKRALVYEATWHLGGLAPVAPILATIPGLDALDLSRVDVDFSANGALFGVVAGVGRDGAIALEPKVSKTGAIEGTTDLRVDHFRWARGDVEITSPALAWHGDMHVSGPRRTLDSRLEIGRILVDLGDHSVELAGIRDEASGSLLGDLANPEIELSQRLALGTIVQNIAPEYPLGDVTFSLTGERTPEGLVHFSDLRLDNALGGTAIRATGNLDFGEGRESLAVKTSATQDLGHLSTSPALFKGQGKVTIEADVASPNLARYDVRSDVAGEDVTVMLPPSGVAIERASGKVPVSVVLEVGRDGVTLPRTTHRSPYSMLRFADQHPLLTHSGFLSIARLKTPFVSIAPLVGNLAIEQNEISLRQFEMGVRGGTITGQCGLDWDGLKSALELHVRATGVKSSHGEPFDGNIAVTVSAADRTIEGRAEILRIGERHLLDLLDMQDPLHTDPGMNRVRSAMNFGYPESLRLTFDHGFASAHLELGGLARLISIGELRGIPMGPIVDKMIASMLEGRETKEAP